ncbi:hypothetical protein [Streptomyces tendae]|uniref:VG15 protein n=1 Tax=Streptomyces tendae TaxID=1932 RepID=UPI0024918AAA|nr:hypothetical protein [Streptomyces tendae]
MTTLLLRDLRGLRRLINPERLQATVPSWIAAVAAIAARYSEVSATLAADFYEGEREAAEVPGTFTVPLADPPPDGQIDASMRWATKDVWDRDPETATALQMEPLDVRLDAAFVKADMATQKLVADVGRETVRQAVRQDRQAVAYARVAALGACSFCKLMASRGAVYATADTAGRDANDRFSGDASVVKFHDNCHCGILPVFRGQQFQLSPHAARWDEIYREYAQGHPGDQLRLFRRALAEHDEYPLPGSH